MRRIWLRPLPFALLAGYLVARSGRAPIDDAAPSRSAALCGALAKSGLTCAADDVTWIDGPAGLVGATFGRAQALVRARDANDEFDIHSVFARLSPEGHLLDIDEIHDLTRSPGADEERPIVRGALAAYVVSVDGRPEAVHVLDLAGHDAQAYDELTRMQRYQIAIADWQQTGRLHGIKRTVFALVPSPARATLAWTQAGELEVATDGRSLLLDPVRGAALEGTAYVRITPELVSKPPTFAPWMSDRLRAVSWFGDENNQALKAIVFTGLEWLKGAKSKLTGDTGEKDVAEDLGALAAAAASPAHASFNDPEVGWPPRALDPLIKPALAGEGQWIRLDDDPFITPIPGLGSPFATTFVRTDPSAQHTRVYITMWDPRLVALHMEAGTVEPVTATGEAGTGQIPRTPEVMRHVVAGFNGGFQATHGEFGMQVSGRLYLPPKPYAATVAELRDGTTAFGAWPRSADVPDEILSYRQNMTALIQNDKYNPWGRAWWGGVPPGWHDAIHTTRSGLCLTKENFVAYFWGNDIGPEPLGRAMLVARCAFGIHLDMNPGLAGFEFYDVQPASTFKPLGRPLQKDWEHEGSIKEMPDVKFRSRRMIKSMGHILFPRYVQRDARDFFYLTTRTVLPGAPLALSPTGPAGGEAGGESGEGTWRVKGLPQHGFPYAIATTTVRLGADPKRRVRVLRIDPRTVHATSDGGAGSDAQVVTVFGAPTRDPRESGTRRPGRKGVGASPESEPSAGAKAGSSRDAHAASSAHESRLWLGAHVFSLGSAGGKDALPIADVLEAGAPGSELARAAVGISDEDGMLQWVELMPEDRADANASTQMLDLLARLGCSSRGLLAADVRAYPGGSLDLGGTPAAPAAIVARLLRSPSPGARAMFETTEIVPQPVWYPLQSQRLKWRPTLAPPEKPAASGSASSAPTPAPRPSN